VREIATAVHQRPDAVVVYDGSHVLGLLAGGGFQKPLEEGADIIFGSTHKTFPGPQGGIILSSSATLMDRIAAAIYPPIVTNHHSFRIPALAVALDEMQRCGVAYVRQIVTNSQALGAALADEGFTPLCVEGHYSQSHTLLVPVPQHNGKAAEHLEQYGIIAGNFRVPKALGSHGIRIGTQELTRQGATPADMPTVAGLMAAALRGAASVENIRQRVVDFTGGLPGLTYA
jgi:glycine hydroxymethyltransferase